VPHKREEPNPEEAVTWNLEDSDAAYLDRVLQVQEDIRNGRYYQLNLLRFWFSQGSVSRAYWLARLKAAGGPFAALVEMPDLGLVSCSPERFVEIQEGQERNFTIRTEPIKGTRPVHNDPEKDQQERLDLAQHPKDRAELSMIVDLMRNDLQKVCQARSVRVLDPGSVHSFSHVHHLIAQIEGRVRPEVRWQDIWTALCPGGSITGAPKIEVMKTISEYESRPRSYLMGHIFYLDAYSGC
jgi:para-aminobenzoate synthetase component 1